MPGFGTWSKSIIFMVKTFAVQSIIKLPQVKNRYWIFSNSSNPKHFLIKRIWGVEWHGLLWLWVFSSKLRDIATVIWLGGSSMCPCTYVMKGRLKLPCWECTWTGKFSCSVTAGQVCQSLQEGANSRTLPWTTRYSICFLRNFPYNFLHFQSF